MKKTFLLLLQIAAFLFAANPLFSAEPSPKDSVEKKVYSVSKDLDAMNALLKEFRAKGDSTAAGIALYHIGRYYNQESEYILSINTYKDALTAHGTHHDSYESVRTIIGLATSERRIGSYSDAAYDLFNGLKILEESDYVDTDEGKRHHSYLYNGLGNVYKYLNNGNEAEEYFRLSLFYDEQINNYTGMAMNWSTIGSIYEYRNMLDSAEVMYNRAMEFNRRGRSTSGVGICLNHLGQLSRESKDLKKAEEQFLEAYDSLSKAKDRWNLAKSTMSLAAIYIDNGDLAKAKHYIDESEELVGGRHSYGHEQEVHSLKAMLNAKAGKYKDAYQESLIALAYKDSSANQKDDQEVAQSRINFIQEQNLKALDKIQKERERESSLKRIIGVSGLASTIILFLLALIMFFYWRLQQKLNKHLAESNALRDRLLSIMSHDVKNPVIAQKNSLKLLEEHLDDMPKDVLKAHITELARSSDYTLRLFTNILDWSKLQIGRMTHDPIRVDIHNVCMDTINTLKESMKQKEITVEASIPPETFAFCDINMFSTVLRNLISNAIKYSNLGSKIEIFHKDNGNGKYWIYVKDYGVGMDSEMAASLLKGKNVSSSIGTFGERGTALGLVICKEFIELAGGEITLETSPGAGSTFGFTVLKSE